MPKVSIITAIYNGEKFFNRLFNCIQSQTMNDFEWIVINDASKDNTSELLSKAQNEFKQLIVINNEQNLGVSASRNKGLDKAKGKYIAFIDCDDLWHMTKLETQLRFMEENDLDLTYMDYERVDIDGKVLNKVSASDNATYSDMLKSSRIGFLTAMFKSDLLKDTRFLKIGHEDYVFWLSLMKNGIIAYKCKSDFVLCQYTVDQKSLSGNKMKAVKWQWNIYRKYLNLPMYKVLWYFFHYIFHSLFKRI